MKYLVTGAAGFIGYHVVRKLLEQGQEVTGADNINNYYDPELKFARLAQCGIEREEAESGELTGSKTYSSYRFLKVSLEHKDRLFKLFDEERPDIVIHLAAQAGVRYSLQHPEAYIRSNIEGFLNILEGCRAFPVQHLVFASSSSVYGLNRAMPFSEHSTVDHPVSLYAATKKANELMAHSYSHLFGIPSTGLRFFTVYGPWGRPDMALFIFTRSILNEEPIEVFNNGEMARDFTYIDDITEGILRIAELPPAGRDDWDPEHPDPAFSSAPYRIFNIGNNSPVRLLDFVHALEKELGKKATLLYRPMQLGDVPGTWADVSDLEAVTGYRPRTSVEEGVHRFVRWYLEYFKPT
ncbi:MAG: NAD-dependent epimerase [Bacteroidales bacterium]